MDYNDIYKSPTVNILFFNKMKNNLKEQLDLYNKLSLHINDLSLLKSINNIECGFILNYNNNISNTNTKINDLMEQIKLIENYIELYCNHDWIIDNIDINIDKSTLISYCNDCYMTK